MKIVKYGMGQKPHVNIKFQCSYCQTKFIADEFEYTLLTKSDDYYKQCLSEINSVLTNPELTPEEAALLETLQFHPVAQCKCPACHQTIYKELHDSYQLDDDDTNKVVQVVCMVVLLITSVVLMIISEKVAAFVPILFATFFYVLALYDQ